MFDQNIQRLGFCCKYIDPDNSLSDKDRKETERPFNTRSTTITWLNRQTRAAAEQRLTEIIKHNFRAYAKLIQYVATLPPEQRMVRLGSDCLPAYTESNWSYFYQLTDIVSLCEREFAKIGQRARDNDVRLSFHPGQFCCIVSDRPDVVDRSLEELEYHATMARMMGFGKEFMDFKINVHLSGRLGIDGFNAAHTRMSPELRNCLTIENDEYQAGLADIVALRDRVALVFDIHHEWIHSGAYISPDNDLYKQVLESWRGVRPTMHYSVSRPELLTDHDTTDLPDREYLLECGVKRGKLRAHSDMYHNKACNDFMRQFWPHTDIMCEAKSKNLASQKLYEEWQI